jgi:hypothetical protein
MATHQQPTAAAGAAAPMPPLVGHTAAAARPAVTDDAPAGSTVGSGLPHRGGGVYWDRGYGAAYRPAYAAVASTVADAARSAGGPAARPEPGSRAGTSSGWPTTGQPVGQAPRGRWPAAAVETTELTMDTQSTPNPLWTTPEPSTALVATHHHPPPIPER